jgi:hypothetical protein
MVKEQMIRESAEEGSVSYFLRATTKDQNDIINEFMTGANKNAVCPFPDLKFKDILVYGATHSSVLTDDFVKKFISPHMLTFRWHNVRDVLTQGIIEADKEYPREFMTQSKSSPLKVFKAHLEKLGNPRFAIIFKRPIPLGGYGRKVYDSALGSSTRLAEV